MKKAVLMTIVFCIVVFLPMNAYAKTYDPENTDMSISIDDSIWYVFTRDNIKNNPELLELEISYDEMYDALYENDAYLDALLVYDDGEFVEFFVRKKPLNLGIANFSNYTDEEIMELAEELGKEQNTEDFSVYEKNRYKFVKLEYFDSNYDYYICEFITCINGDNYTLTFQTPSPYSEWEYEEIEKIVDSVKFDVDPTIKEDRKKSSSVFEGALGGAIKGGIIGAGVGLIAAVFKKKRKKNNEETENDTGRNNGQF